MPAWAGSIYPDSDGGHRRICENGVAVAALLPSIENPQRAENGVGLRAEHLLIVAQVVAAARQPLRRTPRLPLCPQLLAVSIAGLFSSMKIRPGRRALRVGEDPAWEGLLPAPFLVFRANRGPRLYADGLGFSTKMKTFWVTLIKYLNIYSTNK